MAISTIFAMTSELFLRAAQYRIFWRLRAFAQQQRSRVLGQVFRLRYSVRDERTNARILFSIVRLTIGELLRAVFFAGALQILELVMVPFVVSTWPIPDSANYVAWLTGLAQIGGVFIALYFTAVTAAAGAIYAQVPNNVRDLLTRERVGSIYIRYLILATFLPLCLIAFHLFGLEPLRLALPVLVIMAGIGIIAFTTLGRRAFDLFDPTRLADSLFNELGRWLDQVSAGGFRWQDRAFQNHAHRQAKSITETLRTLADLAAAHENLDGTPLLNLSVSVLVLLSQYQKRKLRMPSDSFWFEQTYEHKDWYMTEDTSTSMAHNTGTTLSPRSVPKHDWLEERLELIPLKCFQLNVGRKRIENVRDLVGSIQMYIDALVQTGNAARASSFVNKLRATWEESSSKVVSGVEGDKELAEDGEIADVLGFFYLEILVDYRKSLEDWSPERTLDKVRAINWTKPESVYLNNFLPNEVRQLDWCVPRIRFEREVEGTVKTPDWYVSDLILKLQMENVIENVDSIFENYVALKLWSERLQRNGRHWQAGAVLARSLEFVHKMTIYLPFFVRQFEELTGARHLSDLQWPEVDKVRWIDKASELKDALSRSLAQQIMFLLHSNQKPIGAPDYLGQFIDESGENLFDALINKDAGLVQGLFARYLVGALNLFERMKPANPKPDVWTEQKMQIAVAPILDVLELCGYAKLLADLHGEEKLWTAIAHIWTKLLAAKPNLLPWLSLVTSVGIPTFQIPHRGFRRGEWSTRVQRKLDELPRRRKVHRGSGLYFSEDVVHPSSLVRYCAKHRFHNGWEIFAALYLSKQPGGDTLQWGMAHDFNESLEREDKTYEGDADDDSDSL
jgi:hypothetical protein